MSRKFKELVVKITFNFNIKCTKGHNRVATTEYNLERMGIIINVKGCPDCVQKEVNQINRFMRKQYLYNYLISMVKHYAEHI